MAAVGHTGALNRPVAHTGKTDLRRRVKINVPCKYNFANKLESVDPAQLSSQSVQFQFCEY
jgi:hypothetical protein